MAKMKFKTVAGIFLVALGIIGLFLPVLQGLLFIFIGLGLLGNISFIIWLKKRLKQIF
ncbi:hypothetical protein KY311_02195 [Candidatus Woesearchaeota archaeon]|nr:hypothetical protein [Candidatus Woesearchaeota archaeon]MBW3016760.1 hypothetical protein [Candidatus Woesearchaeota archaeon]